MAGDEILHPVFSSIEEWLGDKALARKEVKLKTRLSTEAALLLILGPSLLPALALEHANRAAILGIEHGPKERGLIAALAARRNRIGCEAGKDFVFEFVLHEQ
jgi:hypothetical protein